MAGWGFSARSCDRGKRVAALAAVALLVGAGPAPAPPAGFSMRVMTYNIHSCKGMDGKVRPDRIAAVIAQFQPDIVALQEVRVGRVNPATIDKPSAEGKGRRAPAVGEAPLPPPTVIAPRRPGEAAGPNVPFSDQPRAIAHAAGLGYVFYPLERRAAVDYGIALLSRYPIHLVRAANLPTKPGRWFGEKRGAIWAEVIVNGRAVQVVATHLGLNSAEREEQVTALLGPHWMSDPRFHEPFVICGDLNSTPLQSPYHRLSQRFLDAARSAGPHIDATWPSRWPVLSIDHIFIPSNAKAYTAQVPHNALAKKASDHLPLIVDVLFEWERTDDAVVRPAAEKVAPAKS